MIVALLAGLWVGVTAAGMAYLLLYATFCLEDE